MNKNINHLSKKDIADIIYLSKQGNGRHRLIKNLFRLNDRQLSLILSNYV